jgi:methionine-S-sulfoxide reductase
MKNSLILAGGCFWCVEHDLWALPGVVTVTSGYSGGEKVNPTYDEVCRGGTGHREAVLVEYDAEKNNFKHLVQFFLDHIDPTDGEGQFADRGESYTPAIFYENEEEKATAENLLAELDSAHIFDNAVAVVVLPRKAFYAAEDYHQDYADKNPVHYGLYAQGSGRVDFVSATCVVREKFPWKD